MGRQTNKKKGRKESVPNLKRTEKGTFINQYGVEFTEQEKKALISAVNSANNKRRRMLKEASTLPRMVRGVDTGDTVGSLQAMGRESDFILARKTKSLQRYRNKSDYVRYMKNLERVNSRDYITDRIKLYKRNHMKAIENAFGDDAKDVMMKIRMMKPKDYMRMVESDEFLEINIFYDGSKNDGKLNQLRASLGMKLKED